MEKLINDISKKYGFIEKYSKKSENINYYEV